MDEMETQSGWIIRSKHAPVIKAAEDAGCTDLEIEKIAEVFGARNGTAEWLAGRKKNTPESASPSGGWDKVIAKRFGEVASEHRESNHQVVYPRAGFEWPIREADLARLSPLPPIYFRLTPDRWRRWVLDLDPVARFHWSRSIARSEPLRDDTLAAECASVGEDHFPRIVKVLAQPEARMFSPTH